MVKIKIAEALRIISERDIAKNAAIKKEKSKIRLAIRYQNQKEELKQIRAELQLKASERERKKAIRQVQKSLGLPLEKKAYLIEKTCSCGRKFRVLTHHKGMRRRRCRVCKPY